MRSSTIVRSAWFVLAVAFAAPTRAAVILPGNTTDVTLTSAPALTSLGIP
jgi:hypothetical protein